jgi:AAA15 family ATPase/GTPase
VKQIIGPNGIGKSSVLAALMLWLRGYNILLKNQVDYVELNINELSLLLNNPSWESVDITHFLSIFKPKETETSISSTTFECVIDALNSELKLTPTPREKIVCNFIIKFNS